LIDRIINDMALKPKRTLSTVEGPKYSGIISGLSVVEGSRFFIGHALCPRVQNDKAVMHRRRIGTL
jgi:hypothetical protein